MFKCILYLFSRKKNARVVPVTYSHVDTEYINYCYDKLKETVNEFAQFLDKYSPRTESQMYVLPVNIYNKRCEFVSHFDALYTSLQNEVLHDGISSTLYNYISYKLQSHRAIFDKLDAQFIETMRRLAKDQNLVVDGSGIYTASFLNLFTKADVPPCISRNVKDDGDGGGAIGNSDAV